MKKYLLLLAYITFAHITFAQQIITGNITNNRNKPLRGASITLVGTYDGATTDSLGQFKFTTQAKGKKQLSASYTGYTTITQNINLDSTIDPLKIILKEKISSLKAIVITAGAFEASDEKKSTILKPLDIVTTAGSNGDNFSALKTLPGTQQTNDKEGLFVRGGTGYETQTYIDGTLVRNAFLTSVPDLGSRGRFNPFLFKGTTFSTGGYSALYGQALSSAVILETENMPEKSQGFFNLSSVGIGAGILKVNKPQTQSYSIGYNHTNLSPYFALVKQNVSYAHAPVYNQLDLSYRIKTSKAGLLKLYGYINNGNLDINRNDIDSYQWATNSFAKLTQFKLHNFNYYLNASYKDYIGKHWKINIGSCISNNIDDIKMASLNQNLTPNTDTAYMYQYKNFVLKATNTMASGKVVLQRGLGNLNVLRIGAEYIHFLDKQQYQSNSYQIPTQQITDNYTAGFAETDIYLSNNLAGKIGIRAEHSGILSEAKISPRLSLAYKVHPKGQISLAYGTFYQKPENKFLFTNTNLGFMSATHYIANYLYQTKDYLLRAELYHKQYNHLIKTTFSPNMYMASSATNQGTGFAQGVELFFRDKKTIPGFDYWISYSYINTKRNYLYYLRNTQPDFVSNHVASLVFKKFWVKKMFGINGTYTFTTGRPYLNYNTTNPYLPSQNAELFLADKTPNFHNVSVSINYLKPYKKTFNVFVASINNIFNLKQTYGYNYSLYAHEANGDLYRNPITPAARQFFFLGWFMSWGLDKTEDAINNNL